MEVPQVIDILKVSGPGRAGELADRIAEKPAARPRRKVTKEHDIARARKACMEFEAIFIQKMLSAMREASKSGSEEEEDFGGDIFKSMMDEQLSVALSKGGGIGLAEMLGESLGIEQETPGGEPGSSQALPVTMSYRAYREMRTDRSLKAFEPEIASAASDSGVSENLIRAVILQESGGDPGAVSSKGAKGLMQLMDATARELGVRDSFSPAQNIRGGARYLGRLLREFKGDLELALASYNAGIGAVKKYGGVPPYGETKNYVRKVMARLEKMDSEAGG